MLLLPLVLLQLVLPLVLLQVPLLLLLPVSLGLPLPLQAH